jgi:hypothetical protein
MIYTTTGVLETNFIFIKCEGKCLSYTRAFLELKEESVQRFMYLITIINEN